MTPRKLVVPLCLVVTLTACGGQAATDDPATDTTATETTTTPPPVTPEATATPAPPTSAATPTTVAPAAIVSLSPTATEILFAIGAGDQVIAVDDQSDYPPDVPTTDLSGFEPNVEAIAGYDPDLVVVSFAGEDLRVGLEGLGIDVLEQPAAVTLDDTYAQITQLGEVTGHTDEAEQLVADMQSEIEGLLTTVPEREALTYYHELDENLFSITSDTFIGQLYSLASMASVADAADPEGELGGYPQLSAEYLVDADPEFVFLADTECCGQTAETFAARPGFAEMRAVVDGHVVELSDDVASRWGPRVVDFLRTVIEATAGAGV